jgi:hypothetical protein
MKVTVKGAEVEGNPEEIATLLALLPESATRGNPPASSSKSSSHPRMGRERIPDVEQIKVYIKSQPEYKHSWEGLQKHFLGTTLKLSKSKDLYRFFNNRFVLARQQIVSEEGGSFVKDGEGFKFEK